jgi:hypothetical protein
VYTSIHAFISLRAGIAQSAMECKAGVDSRQEQEIILHAVHTLSGAQLASYPMGIGSSFLGSKEAEARS